MVYMSSEAVDLTGLLNSHDPATLIQDGDTYWHFTTGNGIWSSISTNLIHWEASDEPVFPVGSWPSWINDYVPDFGGHFWAPDIIFMNGKYYLYYSCSTWGSSRSAIGVVMTESLNSPDWQDLGVVVSSNGSSTAINAIDPGLFRDTDGRIYMTYGSWFGGIGIVEIDSVYGISISETTHVYGGDHQSIEASTIIKENGYYYLIVNRGNCCQGINSTYYITAGRSTHVMGPYSDFRTILASEGKYIGPGHFGLFRKDGCNYVSIHYYDGNDNGRAKLDILKMTFFDGWSELTRDFTFNDPCITGIEIMPCNVNDCKIEVYPNPTDGNFNISLADHDINAPRQLTIYDIQGRKVFVEGCFLSNRFTVSPKLDHGIYFIRITSGNQIYLERLVVQ